MSEQSEAKFDHLQNKRLDVKEVFELYYSRLCYFAFKILDDTEKAKDVVQDVFVVLWNKMNDFDNELSVKNFLYLSVKNACLNVIRHDGVKQKFINAQDTIDFVEENVTANLITAEVYGDIHRAIDALPSGCKNVLKLSYFDGLKNDEIAAELSVSVNTVKTQKARALQLLRLKLDKFSFLFVLALIAQR